MTKLLKLFFSFSIVLLLVSCGKDDDPVAKGDLEGTWTAIAYSADIKTSSGGSALSTIVATGTSFDYDLNLDGSMFTTSGSYSANQTVTTPDFTQSNAVDYTNISGSGAYTVDGNIMTIEGSFFDFEAGGMGMTGVGEMQTATFVINGDGELILNQNETITDTSNGITVDAKIVSSSTWVRK